MELMDFIIGIEYLCEKFIFYSLWAFSEIFDPMATVIIVALGLYFSHFRTDVQKAYNCKVVSAFSTGKIELLELLKALERKFGVLLIFIPLFYYAAVYGIINVHNIQMVFYLFVERLNSNSVIVLLATGLLFSIPRLQNSHARHPLFYAARFSFFPEVVVSLQELKALANPEGKWFTLGLDLGIPLTSLRKMVYGEKASIPHFKTRRESELSTVNIEGSNSFLLKVALMSLSAVLMVALRQYLMNLLHNTWMIGAMLALLFLLLWIVTVIMLKVIWRVAQRTLNLLQKEFSLLEFVHVLDQEKVVLTIDKWLRLGQALGIPYSMLTKLQDYGACDEKVAYYIFNQWKSLEKPTCIKLIISLCATELISADTDELSNKYGLRITEQLINDAKQEFEDTELMQAMTYLTPLTDDKGNRMTLSCILDRLASVSDWNSFGCQLLMLKDKLPDIYHPPYSILWKADILITWMQLDDDQCSLESLSHCLKCIGMSALAKEFYKEVEEVIPVKQPLRKDRTSNVLKNMVCAIKHVTKELFEVGLHLDVPFDDLQIIQMRERLVAGFRLSMLKKWSEREHPEWQKLVIAIVKARSSPRDVIILANRMNAVGIQMCLPRSLKEMLKAKLDPNAVEIQTLDKIPDCQDDVTDIIEKPSDDCAEKTSKSHTSKKGLTIRRLLEDLEDFPRDNWFMLGSWLEIEVEKLQEIKKDSMTSDFCMMNMLNTWMQRCKDVCKLVDALKNIGKEDLAARIAKKHGLKDPVIHHYDTQQADASARTQVSSRGDQVDLRSLSIELSSVLNWFELGLYLGTKPAELLKILRNPCHQRNEDFRRAMFTTLLKAKIPTWTDVVYALLQMELICDANRVARNHGVKLPPKLKEGDVESGHEVKSSVTGNEEDKKRAKTHNEEHVAAKKSDGQIKLNELVTDLDDAAFEWYAFGISLGFESYELNEIEMDNRGDVQDCFIKLMEDLMKRQTPTWDQIVNALVKIHMQALAYRVAQKHGVTLQTEGALNEVMIKHENELLEVKQFYNQCIKEAVTAKQHSLIDKQTDTQTDVWCKACLAANKHMNDSAHCTEHLTDECDQSTRRKVQHQILETALNERQEMNDAVEYIESVEQLITQKCEQCWSTITSIYKEKLCSLAEQQAVQFKRVEAYCERDRKILSEAKEDILEKKTRLDEVIGECKRSLNDSNFEKCNRIVQHLGDESRWNISRVHKVAHSTLHVSHYNLYCHRSLTNCQCWNKISLKVENVSLTDLYLGKTYNYSVEQCVDGELHHICFELPHVTAAITYGARNKSGRVNVRKRSWRRWEVTVIPVCGGKHKLHIYGGGSSVRMQLRVNGRPPHGACVTKGPDLGYNPFAGDPLPRFYNIGTRGIVQNSYSFSGPYEKTVSVKWDNGYHHQGYRWGHNSCYDIELVDTLSSDN